MTALFVDASVVLAAFDTDDSNSEASQSVLADPRCTVATLDLARYEVANVAVRSWRARDDVAILMAAIDRIADDGGVVASSAGLIGAAAELADAEGLSVYDASYVVASRAGGRILVSCDLRDLVTRRLAHAPAEVLDMVARNEPKSDS